MTELDLSDFEEYNCHISAYLTKDRLKETARLVRGPAGLFARQETGEWLPTAHPGYSIITPPFGEERDPVNVAAYGALDDVQQALCARLGLVQFAPVPISSFHLTIASLISGGEYEERVAGPRERDFRRAVCAVFDGFSADSVVRMEVQGVSLFRSGVVVALAGAEDAAGYRLLLEFRRAVYGDKTLRGFGAAHGHPYTAHVTLAYVEDTLSFQDRDRLAETLLAVNERYFAKPLPFNISAAELRKFDGLAVFYRQGGWPVFRFG